MARTLPRPAEPGEPPVPGGPLSRREFRLYFAGNLVSNSGTWLQNVALGVFMLELTDSSFWVGLTGFALFLPTLLFALPAGVLADRTDRLKLLRNSQIVAGSLTGVLTVLVATGSANRWAVLGLAGGVGLSIAVAIPAMQAVIPALVPHHQLADAISLNALTFNVARAIGPIIAAATIAGLGFAWAFGINTATFFVLVGALLLIGKPPFPRPGGPPGPMREGIAYAWRHLRTRTQLLAIATIGVALDPIITLSPALAREYGLATGGAGWIVSAWGGGAVLMVVAGRRVMRHVTAHGLGWAGLLALAAGMAGYGAAQGIGQAVPAVLLAGAGYITATIAFTTTIQADVPEQLRGRVSALWTVAFLGPRTFAAALDGAIADLIGPHVTAALFAIPALVAAWFVRRYTPLDREPVEPPA